jgi:hypothetical protein
VLEPRREDTSRGEVERMADDRLKREVRIDPAVGSVEVKITARIDDEDLILRLLEQRGEEPQERTLYFFDTPELALFDVGLVLRARRIKGDTDDSTVKIRPVEPSRIPLDWVETEGFEVEMDRVGDRDVISAKLTAEQDRGEIDQAVAGRRPLRKLFSKDQERLIAEFGPAEVGWDDLTAMGPIAVQKWKIDAKKLGHEVTVERWRLPDGSDLIEGSIKVKPGEAEEASVDFLAFLRTLGIEVDGDQQTKTRGALTFFTTGRGFD